MREDRRRRDAFHQMVESLDSDLESRRFDAQKVEDEELEQLLHLAQQLKGLGAEKMPDSDASLARTRQHLLFFEQVTKSEEAYDAVLNTVFSGHGELDEDVYALAHMASLARELRPPAEGLHHPEKTNVVRPASAIPGAIFEQRIDELSELAALLGQMRHMGEEPLPGEEGVLKRIRQRIVAAFGPEASPARRFLFILSQKLNWRHHLQSDNTVSQVLGEENGWELMPPDLSELARELRRHGSGRMPDAQASLQRTRERLFGKQPEPAPDFWFAQLGVFLRRHLRMPQRSGQLGAAPSLAWAPGALTLFFASLVFLSSIISASAYSLPNEALFPVKQTAESALLLLAPAAKKSTLRAAFNRQREEEIAMAQARGLDIETSYEDIVQACDGDACVIGPFAVRASPQLARSLQLRPGARVRVHVSLNSDIAASGLLVARSIEFSTSGDGHSSGPIIVQAPPSPTSTPGAPAQIIAMAATATPVPPGTPLSVDNQIIAAGALVISGPARGAPVIAEVSVPVTVSPSGGQVIAAAPLNTATAHPTATALPQSRPTATPKPKATATPKPRATTKSKPTVASKPKATASKKNKTTATPKPRPTKKKKSTAASKPKATARPKATATATPKPRATATSSPVVVTQVIAAASLSSSPTAIPTAVSPTETATAALPTVTRAPILPLVTESLPSSTAPVIAETVPPTVAAVEASPTAAVVVESPTATAEPVPEPPTATVAPAPPTAIPTPRPAPATAAPVRTQAIAADSVAAAAVTQAPARTVTKQKGTPVKKATVRPSAKSQADKGVETLTGQVTFVLALRGRIIAMTVGRHVIYLTKTTKVSGEIKRGSQVVVQTIKKKKRRYATKIIVQNGPKLPKATKKAPATSTKAVPTPSTPVDTPVTQ